MFKPDIFKKQHSIFLMLKIPIGYFFPIMLPSPLCYCMLYRHKTYQTFTKCHVSKLNYYSLGETDSVICIDLYQSFFMLRVHWRIDMTRLELSIRFGFWNVKIALHYPFRIYIRALKQKRLSI